MIGNTGDLINALLVPCKFYIVDTIAESQWAIGVQKSIKGFMNFLIWKHVVKDSSILQDINIALTNAHSDGTIRLIRQKWQVGVTQDDSKCNLVSEIINSLVTC